jgi:hypothetical protein
MIKIECDQQKMCETYKDKNYDAIWYHKDLKTGPSRKGFLRGVSSPNNNTSRKLNLYK